MEAKTTNSNKKKESEQIKDIKVNPLRKEKIYLRYVPHEGLAGKDHKHVLSEGRANGALTVLTVPILLSTKTYKNVLTNDEKDFLEQALGLDKNALSVYNTVNNFWENYKIKINAKEGLRLDLSNPEDYIKYKVCLANNDIVAPSIEELSRRSKKTYQFVIVSENNENDMENLKADALLAGAVELGKIESDWDTMRTLAEILDTTPYGQNTTKAFLKTRLTKLLQQDSKAFYRAITDPMLHTKVIIRRALELGKISRRGDYYYLASNGSPLCEDGENPTFAIAAKYLNEPAHQDIKFLLESEVEKQKSK